MPVIKIELFLSLVTLALCIYCVIEAIVTDNALVRHLPKVVWVLLILFFPLVGSIAWLVAGRPQHASPRPSTNVFPEYDRPGRATGVTPESDQEFLRRTRERAEEQRRRYEEQQRARGADGDPSGPSGD